MMSTSMSKELIEKLNELRGGPLPPPRPTTPLSDLPIQLKSEILISINFLKSYFNESHNLQPIVISPTTISASLAMILSGASKETLDEIESIFGKNLICDNTCFEGLLYYNFLIYSNKLSLSSLLCDDESNDDFLLPIDIENLDEALKKINSKVSRKTADKISTLLHAHQFTPQTSLCLSSTATFIGQWHFSFPFDKPKPRMFYSNPPRQIDMIRQKEAQLWRFSEDDDWTCMNILYDDASRHLFIILPKEKDGLGNLIKKFDYSMIRKCMKGTDILATATIPIFEIKSNTILNDKLKDMGIKQLFQKDGLENLVLNDNTHLSTHGLDLVVHAARIKVDQFGADGRDDTDDHLKYEDLRIQPGYLCPKPDCPEIEFIADQPFIFFVALWKNWDEKNNKVGLKSIQLIGIFS